MRFTSTVLFSIGLHAVLFCSALGANAALVVNTTFSTQGVVGLSTPLNYEAFVGAVPFSDGTVVAAGNFGTNQGSDLIVARFLANGSFDPSFGLGGVAFVDIGASDDSVRAVSPLVGGRIAAVGRSGGSALIAVFRSDGTLDTSFASRGFARTAIVGAASISLTDLASLPDGSLLAAGSVQLANVEHVVLLKYTPQGALDRTLDNDGVRIVREIQGADPRIRVLSDGRIVVAARAPGMLQLIRMLPDGQLDSNFGDHGISVLPAPQFGPMVALELRDDGYLIAERTDGRLSLVDAQGALRATQTLLPGEDLSALVQLADGRVVVSYETVVSGGNSTTLAVARLETNAPSSFRPPTSREVSEANKRCLMLRPGANRIACRLAATRRIVVPGAPIAPIWQMQSRLALPGNSTSVLALEVSGAGLVYVPGFAVAAAQTDFLFLVARLTSL